MSSERSSKKKCVEGPQTSQPTPSETPFQLINELLIPFMSTLAHSSDSSYRLPATAWFCALLSATQDPPIAKVLQSRVVPALLLSLTEENDPELQVEAAKALRCIAFGTSESTKVTVDQVVKSAHDALWYLLHSKDNEVVRHACCSLAVLSGCENVKIRELIRESGLYGRFLELTRHPTLVVAALRTLGNIMGGDEYLMDCMMRDQILVHLKSCLDHKHVEVRKEACWLILHITAEKNALWIQAVIDAGLIEPLVNLVRNDKFNVMEVAIRAISNTTFGATPEQIRFLVSRGCIEPLCYLFCCRNQEIFKVCLEGLENILEAGEAQKINKTDVNPYAKHIDSIEGWGVLEDSMEDYEKKLYKKACDILRRYAGAIPLDGEIGCLSDEDYGSDEDYEGVNDQLDFLESIKPTTA